MELDYLSLYFHPAKICFLDDNERFLKNNILGLDPKFSYCQYHDPLLALNILEKNKAKIFNDRQMIKALDNIESLDEPVNKHALMVNLNPLHQQLFNHDKVDEISVLVVDYAMPRMNGLEVCQQLRDHPVKKLMITGQADHKLAVEAFNQGLIDFFILKDEEKFYDKLNQAIDRLHRKYFFDLSKALASNLEKLDLFCLRDKNVRQYFAAYFKENNIREAYLIDGAGSYLFINQKSNASIIAVKNEAEMAELANIAQGQDASAKFIDALAKRSKMLYFWQEDDYYASPSEWGKYLFPCTTLLGQDKALYYVSVIDNAEQYLAVEANSLVDA